jgi:hypothetical protein
VFRFRNVQLFEWTLHSSSSTTKNSNIEKLVLKLCIFKVNKVTVEKKKMKNKIKNDFSLVSSYQLFHISRHIFIIFKLYFKDNRVTVEEKR